MANMSIKEFEALRARSAANGKPLRIVGGSDMLAKPQRPAVKPAAVVKPPIADAVRAKPLPSSPAVRGRCNRAVARIAPMLAPNAAQRRHTRLLAKLSAFAAVCMFPYGVLILAAWLYISR